MLVSGLSRLIYLGGGFFQESLFREDKNNVNMEMEMVYKLLWEF